ncbi:hypothetical protein KR222_009585 [Zaprionus bogoriensis]|nr:hypothetical protein KR222_009585 [Zaprionus bogoriensis]
MQRCYCGQSGGGGSSFTILKQPRPHSALHSLHSSSTSSSRQSAQPTQFVKRHHVGGNNTTALGLGHSSSGLSREFSRRNSAATTLSHCSSCCSSCGQQLQQRESRVKVLSWASGERSPNNHTNNKVHCEHTDNRRFYEQRACADSRPTAQGQGQAQAQAQRQFAPQTTLSTPSPGPDSSREHSADMQRLVSLQQFRLLNASDCFSAQRQDELRLQRAYDKLSGAETHTDTAKWQKNRANEFRQQTHASTPYALRQKLLQLQLQQDEARGRGSGATCAPLERSCALRYNCQ